MRTRDTGKKPWSSLDTWGEIGLESNKSHKIPDVYPLNETSNVFTNPVVDPLT